VKSWIYNLSVICSSQIVSDITWVWLHTLGAFILLILKYVFFICIFVLGAKRRWKSYNLAVSRFVRTDWSLNGRICTLTCKSLFCVSDTMGTESLMFIMRCFPHITLFNLPCSWKTFWCAFTTVTNTNTFQIHVYLYVN